MGTPIVTLSDLLRPGLRAVCVGINPARESVRVGHYYQGKLGQAFFARLRRARVLPPSVHVWEDDLAVENGIGFTDIVKRPTRTAAEVRREEFDYGRPLLAAKLCELPSIELAVFTFKKAAERYFGAFPGNGFVEGLAVGSTRVFVMPGPYERKDLVEQRLAELGVA